MTQQKQRKIILIDNRFQLRMAGIFIVLQVVLTALFAVGFYMFLDSEIHADLMSAHASYTSLSKMLLPVVVVLSLFDIVLSIVLVSIFVVVLSHKIAGPIYRFRAVLESLAHRHFDPYMKIRPHDQLGEFAISIDKAVSTVKTDMTRMQQSVARLKLHHAENDGEGVATEIAALEKTLEAWKG